MKTKPCAAMSIHDRGATLVEMLIVVALTVLIMSIIAQVFVLSSETFSQLKQVSSSNEKVRIVEKTIRNDLIARTLRTVMPPVETRRIWAPGPDGVPGRPGPGVDGDDDGDGYIDFEPGVDGTLVIDTGEYGINDRSISPNIDDRLFQYFLPVGVNPADELGYFMYEENSPADEQGEDNDDVLSFTVSLRSRAAVPGFDDSYFGRVVPGSEPDAAQPPLDGRASSREAEIIYFVRSGTLYRRVLLVGVPQPTSLFGQTDPVLGRPLNPSNMAPAKSWYSQYDISARPPLGQGSIPIVNSLGDLSYRSTRYGSRAPEFYLSGVPGVVPPIPSPGGLAADFPADPRFPYGAGPLDGSGTVSSLAFADVNTDGQHGAADSTFTHPLDHNHNYPFLISQGARLAEPEPFYGRPLLREVTAQDTAGARLWDFPDNPASTVWDTFANDQPALFDSASIPSEDALLTNVLSFDVKVWDPDAIPFPWYPGARPTGAFVDLGKNAFDDPATVGPDDPASYTPGQSPTIGSPPGLPGTGGPFPAPGAWPPGPSQLPWEGLDSVPGQPGDDNLGNPANPPGPPVAEDPLEYFSPLSDDLDWAPKGRGFGTPYGWLALTNPSPGTFQWVQNTTAYAIPPNTPGLPLGMYKAPPSLARTYDTWCTAYTKPTQLNVVPVAPPYIVPIRALQIRIRFVDEETRQTREITIVQELH